MVCQFISVLLSSLEECPELYLHSGRGVLYLLLLSYHGNIPKIQTELPRMALSASKPGQDPIPVSQLEDSSHQRGHVTRSPQTDMYEGE
jgi:hypothetical protein